MDVVFDWNLGNKIHRGLITLRLCGFPFAEIEVVSSTVADPVAPRPQRPHRAAARRHSPPLADLATARPLWPDPAASRPQQPDQAAVRRARPSNGGFGGGAASTTKFGGGAVGSGCGSTVEGLRAPPAMGLRSARLGTRGFDPWRLGIESSSRCSNPASCCGGARIQRVTVAAAHGWAQRACPWVFIFFVFYLIYGGGHYNRLGKKAIYRDL
jgi:hypothetical protein